MERYQLRIDERDEWFQPIIKTNKFNYAIITEYVEPWKYNPKIEPWEGNPKSGYVIRDFKNEYFPMIQETVKVDFCTTIQETEKNFFQEKENSEKRDIGDILKSNKYHPDIDLVKSIHLTEILFDVSSGREGLRLFEHNSNREYMLIQSARVNYDELRGMEDEWHLVNDIAIERYSTYEGLEKAIEKSLKNGFLAKQFPGRYSALTYRLGVKILESYTSKKALTLTNQQK